MNSFISSFIGIFSSFLKGHSHVLVYFYGYLWKKLQEIFLTGFQLKVSFLFCLIFTPSEIKFKLWWTSQFQLILRPPLPLPPHSQKHFCLVLFKPKERWIVGTDVCTGNRMFDLRRRMQSWFWRSCWASFTRETLTIRQQYWSNDWFLKPDHCLQIQTPDLIQVYRESSSSPRLADTTNTSLPPAGAQAGSRRTTVIIIIISIIIIRGMRSSSTLLLFFSFFLLPLRLCVNTWYSRFTHKHVPVFMTSCLLTCQMVSSSGVWTSAAFVCRLFMDVQTKFTGLFWLWRKFLSGFKDIYSSSSSTNGVFSNNYTTALLC